MRRLKTQNQLQDFLDAELSWRVKEISTLKAAVKSSAFISEQTLVRASVALLYAHWEGFIKSAATGYITYVNNQGLNYSQLKTCFVVLGFKKALHDVQQSKQSHVNSTLIDFLREGLAEKSNLKIDTAINTESNLSASVFENILHAVGFETSPYEAKAHLIDESLLKRRNTIAHGEYIDVAKDDWAKLADEVLQMLRQFKTDIENAMALSAFKRPVAT
ncbi:MAE_28990/MAE_18760 family HEPN-like nuclease [Limnohabitans sp. 63ED37-2]|uniref:MAE_28990/MAE_18760 family HEPN-like nuclease n=1 Tax=Limnohabitans sp. 63ED37-2 TaxID=1678128 RepID=UPI000706C5D7|nr:MAE_28990/MAE_18760 family HEPN-like nuclease [Limnohabitans sp. 63ED37-2]ALK87285.1 hypothetical protein L63ED372_00056 [Limnohabitans sp. 63ED37-2]